jgi:hypothetical protein
MRLMTAIQDVARALRSSRLFISGALLVLLAAGGMLVLLGAQDELTPDPPAPETRPAEQSPERPDLRQTAATDAGIVYALAGKEGLLVSFDAGRSWLPGNNGLPRSLTYPFDTPRLRRLTSLTVDPANPGRVAVTTAREIYVSENYGGDWRPIPLGKPLRSSSYLTAVSFSADDPDSLLVGTSFNGFFETRDRGESWQDPSLSVPFLYRGAGFYEEIAGIAYHPLETGAIIFAAGFGHGLYVSSPDRSSWQQLAFPGEEQSEHIRALRVVKDAGPAAASAGWVLVADTATAFWRYSFRDGAWQRRPKASAPAQAVDVFKQERLRRAGGRSGIYVSSFHASGEALEAHLRFLAVHGLNAITVDMKDDFGYVTYDTRLELPRQIGAVRGRFELETLLEAAHAAGVYVIGRLVVFKDRQLYLYDDSRYAVWDKTSDAPWGYRVEVTDEETGETTLAQNEFWVDPYSSFVWDYNLQLARELQERGIDEIQFDYIRFPSDGRLSRIRYRFQQEGMSRIDALESFLIKVREQIHLPISTDLYGFNSWHRMGNWIGQSIDMLADYVDVICPMFYPSHFPIDFISDLSYLDRARQIYEEGTTRAAAMVAERSLVRPYIQAFLIGAELDMNVQEYSLYLRNQLEGTLAAPASGFTLWNASNRYYMVKEILKPFLTGAQAEPREP